MWDVLEGDAHGFPPEGH